jgi:hypothetical protein
MKQSPPWAVPVSRTSSTTGNEYFIATNNTEMGVSANDAVVKLVGITDVHHAAINSLGRVELHV